MKVNFSKNKGKWIWIGLGSLAIVVRLLLSFSPEFTEQFYSRGLFLGIRCVLDYTLGWLPIPMVLVVIVGLLFFIFYKIRNLVKTHVNFKDSIGRVALSILSFLMGIVFLFLVMWGFNYGRLPVEKTMQLQTAPLSTPELQAELNINTLEVANARNAIPNISDSSVVESFLPSDLENEVRDDVEALLSKLGYPTIGTVRGRLLPKGILLRFSTAGVYFPWTGESNIDGGLHPVQIPFTLAHEFAHGYGFTDEGTCNFLAYLACIQSDNQFFRYSGQLSYWRYVASAFRRHDRKAYKEYFKTLPKGVVADLYAIDANSNKYPDILPEFRDVAYDTFLKAQGVKEGMKSYSRVVMMVKAWRDLESNIKSKSK